MAAVPHPSILVYVGVGALVAWRMYSRIRRVIGRQQLSNNRPKITIVVFTLLFGLLLFSTLAHPLNAVALGGGAALGAALGVLGIRLTKFEQTAEGLFYTPSAHLGIALSVLFIGRMAWRFFQLYSLDGPPPAGMSDITQSPLTLAIFGTLAGYYVTYALGLLRWRRRVTNAA
jgi:hypothetical protein